MFACKLGVNPSHPSDYIAYDFDRRSQVDNHMSCSINFLTKGIIQGTFIGVTKLILFQPPSLVLPWTSATKNFNKKASTAQTTHAPVAKLWKCPASTWTGRSSIGGDCHDQ